LCALNVDSRVSPVSRIHRDHTDTLSQTVARPAGCNLAPYAGQTVELRFTGVEDSIVATSFVVDDAALNAF
jgi:hypothetical protein